MTSRHLAAVPGGSGPDATLALTDGIGFRLSRIVRSRRRDWAEELATLGVTPPQASALRAINECPGISLRALARTLGSDPMSIKRCVDHLEREGIVRSTESLGDRRLRVLTLTAPGRALIRRIDTRVRQDEQRLRDEFSPAEYDLMLVVLDRLEENLGIERTECHSHEQEEE